MLLRAEIEFLELGMMLIPKRAADTVHQDAPAAARWLRCIDSSGVGRAVAVPPWLPHPTARGAKPRQTGAGDGTLIQDQVE